MVKIVKDGAFKYRTIFEQFMTMWEKQILARAIGIQKIKLGVTTHFSEVIKQKKKKKSVKYKAMYGIFPY